MRVHRFTNTSLVAMLMLAAAGGMILVRLEMQHLLIRPHLHGRVLGLLELCLYLGGIWLLTRKPISTVYPLAAAGMAVVRVVLSLLVALALWALGEAHSFGGANFRVTHHLIARLGAAIFSIGVCYPLIAFLPDIRPKRKPRPEKKDAPKQLPRQGAATPTFVFGVTDKARAASLPEPEDDRQVEGEFGVDLETITSQLPASMLERAYQASRDKVSQEIWLPISLIYPMLRKGRLRLTLEQLLPHLPPGVVKQKAQEADQPLEVELPLKRVVPKLPVELFELPEVKPPAWLETAGDQEPQVLFTDEESQVA